LVGILEGLPAGLKLSAAHLQKELARRKLGLGRSRRQGLEADRVEIQSPSESFPFLKEIPYRTMFRR